MKTNLEELQKIKKKWEWFFQFEKELHKTNMLHCMSGNLENCYELIWLIKTLENELSSLSVDAS